MAYGEADPTALLVRVRLRLRLRLGLGWGNPNPGPSPTPTLPYPAPTRNPNQLNFPDVIVTDVTHGGATATSSCGAWGRR